MALPNADDTLPTTTRRRLLIGTGAAAATATAGCTTVVNWLADMALADVNLFNETDGELAGTITVTGPDGETLLDDSFELLPSDDDDNNGDGDDNESEDDGSNLAAYSDVWTDPGEYEATVTVTDGPLAGSEATETVTIDDTEEEMLAVPLGAEEETGDIVFRVGTDLTDFADE